jgi:hypothetical protein
MNLTSEKFSLYIYGKDCPFFDCIFKLVLKHALEGGLKIQIISTSG